MADFIALDVETANPDYSSICQIGFASFKGGNLEAEWMSLVDPLSTFDPFNTSIHSISQSDVEGAPTFEEVHGVLNDKLFGKVIVHHGHFDRTAFHRCYERFGLDEIACRWLDTTAVVRRVFPEFALKGCGLANLTNHFGIELDHHDALSDAKATGEVLALCLQQADITIGGALDLVTQSISGSSTANFTGDGNPEGEYFGSRIVFTGALTLPRNEAAERAKSIGFDVSNSVSKKVTHLCVGLHQAHKRGEHKKSSKQRKAEDLILAGSEIQILSETDFLNLFNARQTP